MKNNTKLIKTIEILLIIISIIGLVDAGYLTVQYYAKSDLICTVTRGCEIVLTSKYSTILGIPVAVLGIIFYLMVLVISIHFLLQRTYNILLLIWTSIGFIMSLYLLFIQAFILRAWCQYCILSAVTSIAIFILCLVLTIKNQRI